MNPHRNCDCEMPREVAAANKRADRAQEERAELVRVVDAIACHLGVDVDAVIEDPSVAIAAHTAAIAAEREACAKRWSDLLRNSLAALGHAVDVLDKYKEEGHDGDEETGEHCKECRRCIVDAALAHAEDVFQQEGSIRARGQEVKP